MRFRSPSPESTRAAGRALAAAVDAHGVVVGLVGPLGAGKTVFVKGLGEGLGVDPSLVASPTFVIASEYAGSVRRLAHVDLYRVETAAELLSAGFLDLLEPGSVVAVEWSDRLPDALPADRLEVRIERPDPVRDPDGRVLNAIASGDISAAVLARWAAEVEEPAGP